jgi:hypothetical protein
MDPPHGGGGYYQIPCSLENPRRAERLPKRDVELAPRRAATEQTAHSYALAHEFYYLTFALAAAIG